MIDKYCRKSGPLGYKVELTFYHIWICKFLTCSVSKRNVKDFFYTSKCLADDVKVALATFFLGEFTSSANSMSLNNMVWYNSPRKKLLKQLSIINQTFRCTEKIFHIPLRNTVRRKFFFISKWSTLFAILINHLTIQ